MIKITLIRGCEEKGKILIFLVHLAPSVPIFNKKIIGHELWKNQDIRKNVNIFKLGGVLPHIAAN